MRLTSLAIAAFAALAFTAPASAGPKHCPPGLAKQDRCPAGTTATPPGHQKQIDRARYERWSRWREAGLDPAPSGQIYVVRNGEVILVDETTYDVINVIGAVSALLD